MNDALIYGKDPVQRIVGSEIQGNLLVNYIADGNKTVTEKRDFYYYVLLEDYDSTKDCGRLGGENDFQYFVKFKTKNEAYMYCRNLDYDNKRYWRCYNDVESSMLREGFTQYKGMSYEDISILSFDIETTGVTIDSNSFVTIISNTFRSRSGVITKKLFAFDEYDSPKHMLESWCKWVREMDPDSMTGHNIFGFDLKYLDMVAKIYKAKLTLGRNASVVKFGKNPRKFRKDGSQAYDYIDAKIFGRELVCTFFLSIRYDVERNYPNYKLKDIIAYEGLEKEDRQHWDFSKNREPWNNASDWAKFKQYAKDDADDSLALMDLMCPQYFYYAQMIPKKFQEIINTATGSQINSLMVRSYLQQSLSIPAADEKAPFEGATSLGIPGLYSNVFGLDFKAMYPSIIIAFNVHNKRKDPDNNFVEITKAFVAMRDKWKILYKDTGDKKYNGMQLGAKVASNSVYGAQGAPGLNFNYTEGAAFVTRKGRELLELVCKEMTGRGVESWKEAM